MSFLSMSCASEFTSAFTVILYTEVQNLRLGVQSVRGLLLQRCRPDWERSSVVAAARGFSSTSSRVSVVFLTFLHVVLKEAVGCVSAPGRWVWFGVLSPHSEISPGLSGAPLSPLE